MPRSMPSSKDDPLDKIVTFACNWCSYAGADTAGVGRMAYPPNARIIRTMCSGRVNPEFVWYAFKKGAPVVLVSGCHYVDCHYIDANRSTVRRLDGLWDGLEKAGLRPERLLTGVVLRCRRRAMADHHGRGREAAPERDAEEVEQTREALGAGQGAQPTQPQAGRRRPAGPV